ncbi:MAG: thioredoxin [Chlamydiota bacterium]
MAEAVKVLNQKTFDTEIAKGLVLVDFYAVWCGPCKMLSPILEQVAKLYESKVSIGKVNIDENEDLASKFEISSVPTIVLFKDGLEVSRFMGLRDLNFLKTFLDKHL